MLIISTCKSYSIRIQRYISQKRSDFSDRFHIYIYVLLFKSQFRGDDGPYLAEDGGVAGGDNAVLVHTSEVPLTEFAGAVYLLKIAVELVDAVDLARAHKHRALDE